MGLTHGIRSLAVIAALLSVGLILAPGTQGKEEARVDILFDLGDGSYYWSHITITDRLAENATWSATLQAANEHGLPISYQWFLGLGTAVFDIGDRQAPAGFAGLYLWNRSSSTWELSKVGVSSLVLSDLDAIAWSNAAFDSASFESRTPVPTPAFPHPALGFRGDGISGGVPNLQSVGTGTSGSRAPDRGTVLWDRDLETREIVSTPAVAYGMLYVETFKGLYALDAGTGVVRWHNALVTGFSSPAVFNGSLLVGASDGRVYRLSTLNGTELWNTSLISQPRFSGITSSPRVAFDWAYIGTFNESGGPGEVVSLWVSDGRIAWRHATGSVHLSSPAVLQGGVYVGVMGTYNTTTNVTFDPPYGVLALSASNGTERWFFATGGPVASSPIATSSVVYAASRDGNLYAIDPSNGTERWRVAVGAGVSSPALYGDAIFVGGGDLLGSGRVSAVDRRTGEILWTYVPNGPVQASVSYADGKIFFSTNTDHGKVYALNASRGTLVWSYEPSPAQYILGSPSIANGTVFAPSDNGHVYAFRDAGGPVPSPNSPLVFVVVGIGTVAVAAVVMVVARRRRRGRGPL